MLTNSHFPLFFEKRSKNNAILISYLYFSHKVIEKEPFTGIILQIYYILQKAIHYSFPNCNFENRKINFKYTKRNQNVLMIGK